MSARYRPAKRLFIGFEDKTTDQRGNVGRNKAIRRYAYKQTLKTSH